MNGAPPPFLIAAFASRCHRSLRCSRTGSLFQLHRCQGAASAGSKSNFSLPDLGEADQAVTNLFSLETHQFGARDGFRCAPSILGLKASAARACGGATWSSQAVKLTRP